MSWDGGGYWVKDGCRIDEKPACKECFGHGQVWTEDCEFLETCWKCEGTGLVAGAEWVPSYEDEFFERKRGK